MTPVNAFVETLRSLGPARLAIMAGVAARRGVEPWSIGHHWAGAASPWISMAFFGLLAVVFYRLSLGRSDSR